MARRPIAPRNIPPQVGDLAQNRVNKVLHDRLDELEARSREEPTVSKPGRWLGRQVLTGAGLYTPTTGTTRVLIRMIGGGGGGGGAAAASAGVSVSAGAGGSSGALLEITAGDGVRPVPTAAYASGAGGAGGSTAGGAGGSGGDTVISIGQGSQLVARGGLGGAGGTATTSGFAAPGGVQSGSSTGGFVTQEPGQPGVVTSANLGWGGSGGSTPLGAGAQVSGAGASAAGSQFGSGGGGACTIAAGVAGGAGAAGCIVVDEFGDD